MKHLKFYIRSGVYLLCIRLPGSVSFPRSSTSIWIECIKTMNHRKWFPSINRVYFFPRGDRTAIQNWPSALLLLNRPGLVYFVYYIPSLLAILFYPIFRIMTEQDQELQSFGTYGLIQSSKAFADRNIEFTEIKSLNENLENQTVWIRGRLHTSRVKGKTCFAVIRHQIYTVQICGFVGETFSKEMVKFIGGISKVCYWNRNQYHFEFRSQLSMFKESCLKLISLSRAVPSPQSKSVSVNFSWFRSLTPSCLSK